MRVGQHSHKRRVCIDGKECESLAAGAREASRILQREVKSWEIFRVLDGTLTLKGITISEPIRKQKKPEQKQGGLYRPPGESPLDMGIPPQWR